MDRGFICHDAGQNKPGCLIVADERYTMDFSDIGENPIYWCAACGPLSKAINDALEKALEEPEFFERFKSAVENAEEKEKGST